MAGTDQTQSAEPAPQLLKRLMAERQVTTRQLERLTQEVDGRGVSRGLIGNIVRGADKATPRVLEVLAQALGEQASVFAEVRLDYARRLFDEREVGLEQALSNLKQFDRALDLAGVAVVATAAGPVESQTRRARPALRVVQGSGQGQ